MTSSAIVRTSLPTTAVGAVAAWVRSPRGQRALRGAASVAVALATEVVRSGALARPGSPGGAARAPGRSASSAWSAPSARPAEGDCAGWQAHRRARG